MGSGRTSGRLPLLVAVLVGIVLFSPELLGALASPPADDLPPSPPLRVEQLTRPEAAKDMQFDFLPVPKGLTVDLLTAEEAAQAAWSAAGPTGSDSATAFLGVLDAPTSTFSPGTEVWVVRYAGVCVPVYGPLRPRPFQNAREGTECGGRSQDWRLPILLQ
jgi:hypothetical protein